MNRHARALFLLICIVLLARCNRATDNGGDTTQASVIETPSMQTATGLSVISLPATPTVQSYVFRESEPGTVTIHGDLLAMDPDNLPAPDDAIYLVALAEGQVTSIPPTSMSEVYQADVNEVIGEFVFTDVEPGRYAVVVKTISNAEIPARTEEGGFVIVLVEEADRDQTVELGFIRIP